MIYTLVKNLFKILFTIFLRLKVEGTENIPKDGPLVIASNHLSLLDPPVLGTAATRKVHFMAKEELFVPVLGTIYKILGAFPVRRGGADRAAIKHGIDILESGQVLAIFPEGTRSKTGELGKAQPGALMMASKAKKMPPSSFRQTTTRSPFPWFTPQLPAMTTRILKRPSLPSRAWTP